MRWFCSFMLLNFFLLISKTPPIQCLDSRKLDETTAPAGTTDDNCTPCTSSPPPPPPPSPPPPSLPTPSPKKPPSNKCPPPPPSFMYIPGPPGTLYPVDNDFGGADRVTAVPALIVCGLLVLLLGFGI